MARRKLTSPEVRVPFPHINQVIFGGYLVFPPTIRISKRESQWEPGKMSTSYWANVLLECPPNPAFHVKRQPRTHEASRARCSVSFYSFEAKSIAELGLVENDFLIVGGRLTRRHLQGRAFTSNSRTSIATVMGDWFQILLPHSTNQRFEMIEKAELERLRSLEQASAAWGVSHGALDRARELLGDAAVDGFEAGGEAKGPW